VTKGSRPATERPAREPVRLPQPTMPVAPDPCFGPWEVSLVPSAPASPGDPVIAVPRGSDMVVISGGRTIGRLDGVTAARLQGCARAGWTYVGRVVMAGSTTVAIVLEGIKT
jgi:hypothetical protein